MRHVPHGILDVAAKADDIKQETDGDCLYRQDAQIMLGTAAFVMTPDFIDSLGVFSTAVDNDTAETDQVTRKIDDDQLNIQDQ